MSFELTDNIQVNHDPQGNVQHLEHLQQPVVAAPSAAALTALAGEGAPAVVATTPQALAEQYLREVAPIYGIDPNMLPGPGADGLTADAGATPATDGNKLELVEEKDVLGTTTVTHQQMYNGLPVWEAGTSVTIQPDPLRVTASQSSVHNDITLPAGESLVASTYGPEASEHDELARLLGLTKKAKITINSKRRLIYRYDPDQRVDPATQIPDDAALQGAPPTLPLPPVPGSIVPGQHYVVTEVLFTYPVEGFGEVHWRAFIEEQTGAVLYLRAFVACAAGMIFRTDPLTAVGGAAPLPTAPAAALNPFRSSVVLEGLVSGNPQALSGQFVRLVDNDAPPIAPPTQANPPANFFYNAPTREFSAANAYYHVDQLFRLVQSMGFNLASYFDGTSFPVPVDACAFSDAINARAPGNTSGTGSGGFQFGLAGTPFPAVSIAADVRVVMHEFGHALLWDSVHSPNFGFAHSAGDSLAAILQDPTSALRTDPVRRFQTFPWVLPGSRNHGRDVAAGWGWDGANYGPFTGVDPAGYLAEQILSTTLFRAYRSFGGDSSDVNRRKLAARLTAYLIFRSIGTLATNPATPTPRPEVYATALMNADIGTSNFEGQRGGALHKAIRWSFEKQGLYQAPGAPRPVTRPGAPPRVDVYINDGRNGEYPYQPVHWECTDIWNRLAPSAGGGGGAHQAPVVGRTNYAYVQVRNRGSEHANNIVVRGYSANPGAGLSWPGDWTPMATPQLVVAGGIAPGAVVVVGPFRWTPRVVGHECMFMEVSADGDFSNIDSRTFFPCATGPTPEWRLVPFDNNIGQRNVVPVPGAGGVQGLLTAFVNRQFLVRNPFDQQARFEIKAEMPPFLTQRGWKIQIDLKDGVSAFGLAAGGNKEVTVALKPGQEFTREQLVQVPGGVRIRVYVYADGMIIGGMTYQLDPGLTRAPIEKVGEKLISLKHPAIREAIRNAQAPADEETAGADLDAPVEAGDGATEPGDEEDMTAAAGQLLAHLGVANGNLGKVDRVKLRKITLEIEMGDA